MFAFLKSAAVESSELFLDASKMYLRWLQNVKSADALQGSSLVHFQITHVYSCANTRDSKAIERKQLLFLLKGKIGAGSAVMESRGRKKMTI